jgi:uncharacterized membrane protein YkvA (DUF1232 family)
MAIFLSGSEYLGDYLMKFPIQSLYDWYRNTLRNPKYRWWIVVGTFAYLLSPFDLLPDLFPIIGEIDDIALVTLLFAEVSQIVVERLKERQSQTDRSNSTDADTKTVEVESVPIQE